MDFPAKPEREAPAPEGLERALGVTPKYVGRSQFDLLVELARQPGRVFTRAQLLGAIYGVVVESYERTVDAHIKNIRRKLEPDPRRPRYLLTVHGVGYKVQGA